jgi:hypothetical protein
VPLGMGSCMQHPLQVLRQHLWISEYRRSRHWSDALLQSFVVYVATMMRLVKHKNTMNEMSV